MKRTVIIISCILGGLILLFIGLISYDPAYLYIAEKIDDRNFVKNLKFPDNIQNVYYVATLSIDDPVVVFLNDDYYILPESALKEYDGCDSLFLSRRDVIASFTYHYKPEKYYYKQPYDFASMSIEKVIQLRDTVLSMPVFEFSYKPKDFVLILYRDFERDWESLLKGESEVLNTMYSNKYLLALHPRFKSKQLPRPKKIILEEYGPDDLLPDE